MKMFIAAKKLLKLVDRRNIKNTRSQQLLYAIYLAAGLIIGGVSCCSAFSVIFLKFFWYSTYSQHLILGQIKPPWNISIVYVICRLCSWHMQLSAKLCGLCNVKLVCNISLSVNDLIVEWWFGSCHTRSGLVRMEFANTENVLDFDH